MSVGRLVSALGTVVFLAICLPLQGRSAELPLVPTPRQPVTNVYHGVTVVDDYQWLEHAAAPEVRDWTRQQNERTHAVLLTAGENDGRVNPAQSRKMAARLQAATASDRPVLFRSNAGAGHGIGTALKMRIAEPADAYAFLFYLLGGDASKWGFP